MNISELLKRTNTGNTEEYLSRLTQNTSTPFATPEKKKSSDAKKKETDHQEPLYYVTKKQFESELFSYVNGNESPYRSFDSRVSEPTKSESFSDTTPPKLSQSKSSSNLWKIFSCCFCK